MVWTVSLIRCTPSFTGSYKADWIWKFCPGTHIGKLYAQPAYATREHLAVYAVVGDEKLACAHPEQEAIYGSAGRHWGHAFGTAWKFQKVVEIQLNNCRIHNATYPYLTARSKSDDTADPVLSTQL